MNPSKSRILNASLHVRAGRAQPRSQRGGGDPEEPCSQVLFSLLRGVLNKSGPQHGHRETNRDRAHPEWRVRVEVPVLDVLAERLWGTTGLSVVSLEPLRHGDGATEKHVSSDLTHVLAHGHKLVVDPRTSGRYVVLAKKVVQSVPAKGSFCCSVLYAVKPALEVRRHLKLRDAALRRKRRQAQDASRGCRSPHRTAQLPEECSSSSGARDAPSSRSPRGGSW